MLCHSTRGAPALPSFRPYLEPRPKQPPKCITADDDYIHTRLVHWRCPCPTYFNTFLNQWTLWLRWCRSQTKDLHSHSFFMQSHVPPGYHVSDFVVAEFVLRLRFTREKPFRNYPTPQAGEFVLRTHDRKRWHS